MRMTRKELRGLDTVLTRPWNDGLPSTAAGFERIARAADDELCATLAEDAGYSNED